MIGWGTGAEGARQRLDNIQREDVIIIKQKGATLDMIVGNNIISKKPKIILTIQRHVIEHV